MKFFRHALLLSLGFVVACSDNGPDGLIRSEGVVDTGENCFLISTPDRSYQPLVMPSEFRVKGMRVYFEARPKPTFNTCMAGEVVELVRIERR
jgi:hypothetical protein